MDKMCFEKILLEQQKHIKELREKIFMLLAIQEDM